MASQNLEHLSDSDLASLATKDRTAFAELYERYVDRVYTYVYYRAGNHTLTEDIVQNVFLSALHSISRFEPRGGGFGAWLLRIAHNELIDTRRKLGHIVPVDEMPEEDMALSAEQAALINAEAQGIMQLVDNLPDKQKELVILKYSLGLSNKEIAGATARTETAVSSLLHRAMQRLRKEVLATW